MTKSKLKYLDWTIIVTTLAIFVLGLFILYSASLQKAQVLHINFVARQIFWMGFAVILSIFLIRIDYRKILLFSYFFYAINLLFLILVLFLGRSISGAQRWLSFGFFNFQPSEFMKFTFLLALTNYLVNTQPGHSKIKGIFVPLLMGFFPAILILLQPDLGTALLIVLILFVILFVWGIQKRVIFSLAGLGIIALPFFWGILKEYQKKRILVFLNPALDPKGAGYTIIQSKIAIGSGGLFGKGWLGGTQSQLNFLPERHTDFIFSVIGEEWGFLGAVIFIFLFIMLVRKILFISIATSDSTGKLLCSAVAGILALQVIVNIGMTMGIFPVVGIALPLVTYGGSSLIATVAGIALVLNIARTEREI